MKISFSWDDNHILNMKMADLFEKYGFKATFFINSIPLPNHQPMSDDDIRNLYNRGFEIGAHTRSHAILTDHHEANAKYEITTSKDYLEDIIGSKIDGFCYPKGLYDQKILNLVKEAGFKYARATGEENLKITSNYAIIPTIQVYNSLCRRFMRSSLFTYDENKPFNVTGDWTKLAMAYIWYSRFNLTDRIIIYGHSWEVEKQKQWCNFERLLKWIHENGFKVTTLADTII